MFNSRFLVPMLTFLLGLFVGGVGGGLLEQRRQAKRVTSECPAPPKCVCTCSTQAEDLADEPTGLAAPATATTVTVRAELKLEPKIFNRATVTVDRETPLEVQLAKFSSDEAWKGLTTERYPSDKSRPKEIVIGELRFGEHFNNGYVVRNFIKNANRKIDGVVRYGDPYEFAAWIRHNRPPIRSRRLIRFGLPCQIATISCRQLVCTSMSTVLSKLGSVAIGMGVGAFLWSWSHSTSHTSSP